ncbi:MAG: sulfatase [Planctomycetaceae bacterium]
MESLFRSFDQNGDQRISRKEAGDARFFERADRNANGFVTQCEAGMFVQRQRETASNPDLSQPVFPADPAAIVSKNTTLKQIPRVTEREQRPPNLVLILADDLGYADTGAYGSRAIPTPHIDALAKTGVKFTAAYVTAGTCSPSRAGLMSGRYQQRFGFEFNTSGGAITHRLHRGLAPGVITLPDVLRRAGYATGMFGKWHLGTQPQFHPQVRGFDEFYGFLAGAHSFFPVSQEQPIHSTLLRGNKPLKEPAYLTDAIAREAIRFIDSRAGQPFFAYIPFNAVHTPIQATRKYQDRFRNIQNETRRDYYAMTSALDDAVGAIVAAIERNQLTDTTLVIFLNDNGGPIYTGVQSNAPLRLGKLFLFEGGIRVPMVMKWPGVLPANQVFPGITSSLDVFPTICAAAGITLPDDLPLDGVNLIPLLCGRTAGPPHETLFWSNGPNSAIRHLQWKLVVSGNSRWLFDLTADPGENNNLADTQPQKIRQLEALLEAWRQQLLPPAWPSKPQRRKVTVDGQVYELNI